MRLAPGNRVGPYEIVAILGAGGMGEVYRAHDTTLDRLVALKVLPERFALDNERLMRFEREARTLAAINHPHIAQIYGVHDSNGARAIVMEHVAGSTLAERLARGPLPLDETLGIAGQIIGALAAAHERGIVHRDLKPANIKLRPDGTLKVLDFGLAKVLDREVAEDQAQSPTVTALGTQAGAILGTAPYMSPEQVRGHAVDTRADIWAFGCLLYELLTGRAAFSADSVSDTLVRVLEREPDWSQLPAGTPEPLRRLLGRCLEKDPKRRLRDIGDARFELEDARSPGMQDHSRPPAPPPWRETLRWVLTATALLIAAGLAVWTWIRPAATRDIPPRVARATVVPPPMHQLEITGRSVLALSPNGERLVYVERSGGGTSLYLRNLDEFEPTLLAGTNGANYPFFSPDGQWVAFFADGRLKRVPIRGGSPATVCEVPPTARGGTWGSDGTIVFNPGGGGLMRVPATGGMPEPLSTGDPAMDRRSLWWPQFLPDGEVLLANTAEGDLFALDLQTGTWHPLGRGSQAQYVCSGHLVFHALDVREGEIQAVAFDPERLAIRDEPVTVLSEVFRSPGGGPANFAVAQNGTLVYVSGGYGRRLVRVDRTGRPTPLVDERRGFRLPRVSPDGTRVAVAIDPRPSQLWIYDLARGAGIPLATEGHSFQKTWMPDGRRLTYGSEGTMYSRAADGSSEAESLAVRGSPWSWTRDARVLVFTLDAASNSPDIWMMPPGGEPRRLIATRASEWQPALSPDDRWLAYTSDESGRSQVYVRPFPNVDDGKWPVSTAGGGSPVWSPDGDELFYLNENTVMAVRVTAGPGTMFRAGTPEALFSGPFGTGLQQFDVFPDGTFAMVEADPEASPTRIHVVFNWTAELTRLVPPR